MSPLTASPPQTRFVITGAQVLLPDEEARVAILVEDGRIAAIDRVPDDAPTVAADGLYLLPGLVDLHCDAIEKVIEMRPGVRFPLELAIPQADRQFAAAGITTIYHSISFANGELGLRCSDSALGIVAAIHAWQEQALVDNRIHCRYELADAQSLPVIRSIIDERRADLISVMDHTPGQGQFKDEEAYVRFVQKNYHCDRDEALQRIADKKAEAAANAERASQIIAQAVEAGIPVASHDDDEASKVARQAEAGVTIAEFPVTLAAGAAARAAGQHVLVGSPNIIRGGSQSGSLRAMDALEQGSADSICSDYAPHTMLPAVWRIHQDLDLPLWQAVRCASAFPAEAANLTDRGRIAVGRRADLILVQAPAAEQGRLHPQLRACWTAGRPVSQWGAAVC